MFQGYYENLDTAFKIADVYVSGIWPVHTKGERNLVLQVCISGKVHAESFVAGREILP
jgi:hypothetical protein